MTAVDKSNFVPRVSLSDAVYRRLRDEIMSGELADGSPLNQVKLAASLGVSRIPVREALRRLQAESLIISTPYHPYVVRKVSASQVLELVDIRAALEDFAMSQRGELRAEEIAELRGFNDAMAKGADGTEFLKLDRKLHRLMAGPDSMVVEMIDDVRDKVHKYVNNMVDKKPGRIAATAEHAGIIDALEAKDLKLARRLLHDHIMESRAFIVSRIEPEEQSDG